MLIQNITRETGIVLPPVIGKPCQAEVAFPTQIPFALAALSLVKHSFPANFRQGKLGVSSQLDEGVLARYRGFLHEIHVQENLDSQGVIIHELGHSIDHHLGEYVRYFSDTDSRWKTICEHWVQEDLANEISLDEKYRHLPRELFARAYVMHVYEGDLSEDIIHGRAWYPSQELYQTKIQQYLSDLLNFNC